MKNIFCILIPLTLIFASCDCTDSFESTIVDQNNHPLRDVKVYYLIAGKITSSTETDSAGLFSVSKASGMCNPRDNDVVLTKKGYRSLVLNEHDERLKAGQHKGKHTIVMEPEKESFSIDTLLELSSIHNFFNFFNVMVAIINVFTIFYIFLILERREYWWVIPMLAINPMMTLNLDTEAVQYQLLGIIGNPNFTNRPWIIHVCLPVITILFWLKVKYWKKESH